MQTDEGDLMFTPGLLETPSLLTPDIVSNVPSNQSMYNPLHTISSNNNHHNNENLSTSNPSSIATTTTTTNGTSSTTSSADVKVSKIEDDLKQSINEPRKPTPSPFQKLSSGESFILTKPVPVPTVNTNEDTPTIEIPSTADVVKELEALTNTNPLQFQAKTILSDTNEVNVSPPKKKFLIRSQSHTEPTSPVPNHNNNNHTNLFQSQKLNNNDNSILNTHNAYDDENSIDDSMNHHFTRMPDIPTNDTNQQFKPIIDNRNDQQLNLHIRTDQNNIPHPMIKQQPQPIVMNSQKRTFQQANLGNTVPTLTKANTIVLPSSQPTINEVTSTDQSSHTKRQRTAPMPTNPTVMNFRPSYPAVTSMPINNSLVTNGSNLNLGSDDQRKKQIRDSNREAARRCRERRRQYIEQLEANLDHHKMQIKQLTEKLARVDRENTQLRAILSETKILHPSSRLSLNESHVDYANVVAATGMDLNSESAHQNDGGIIQRNYLNRNNL